MGVQTSRFVNVWSQICIHLKLWVTAARHNFNWTWKYQFDVHKKRLMHDIQTVVYNKTLSEMCKSVHVIQLFTETNSQNKYSESTVSYCWEDQYKFCSLVKNILQWDSQNSHAINLVGLYYCFGYSIELYRLLRYERVYLPLCKVADTPFHIQGDDISW